MEGGRERAEIARAGQVFDELDFLSSAALNLAETRPEEDVFQVAAKHLASLAPQTLVVTNSYDPSTDSMIVRAIVGPSDMARMARDLIGRDLVGLAFRVDKQAREEMTEGKLVHLRGGLYQLLFYNWPVELTRDIEAQLRILSIYAQPFTRKGEFLGTAALLSRAPSLERARLIEAFTRLAAVAIQRRRAEALLRESESRFRMLAENSQDIIFRLRLRPRPEFEYVSPATTRMIGYTPEELYAAPDLGANCVYPESWTASDATSRQLPKEPVSVRCQRKDGTYIWTEQRGTPIHDANGDVLAIEGISRDITTRKEAEEAVIEADLRKTEFLAVLSHELRNPLSPIRNSLYILERVDPRGEQAKRARVVIERQIAHLTRLIDDLLDVTRISRGKIRLQRERVDLNELVRSTVEDHRSIFVKGNLEIEVLPAPAQVWINGDRTRIVQILGNLLLNAVKFTPSPGRTSVYVGMDTNTNEAILRVHDTGVGIAPEILPHLFKPFMQADRTLARSRGGLGLGLALVKGLVELHGGSVKVESGCHGEGTEFTVRFPLDMAGVDAHAHAGPAPSEAAVARVLLIEDNVDAANTLREALELSGNNTVEMAHTGAEGIEKARTFRPDVVLCDIGLPDMDGYAVARAMRADPELRTVALVALSGYTRPEDVAQSRLAGFDQHIAKPPTIEGIERVIAELVGASRRLESERAASGAPPGSPPSP